jgi:hypothetical protein
VVERLFFFHNPKAGGTSLVTALKGLFPVERCCPPIENDATEHTARGGCYDAFGGYDLYAGHYGRDVYREVGEGMAAATNFRWPIDRVVSLYRYFRHAVQITDVQARDPRWRAVTLAKQLSLSDFVTCDDPAVVMHTYDHHFRQLTGSGWSPVYEGDLASARALIDQMVWFYVCEHPYESQAWADMAFAGQLPGVRRLNVTGGKDSSEEALSAKAYRQLLSQNQNDIALYQFALGRLLAEVTPAETRLIA